MVALGTAAYQEHQQHGDDGCRERERGDAEGPESQENGHGRAECRALRGAQDVGRDERVLERALERRAGGRERAAHEQRERDARQAHLEEQRFLLGGPERLDGRYQVRQHAPGLGRRDGKAAEHERGERGRDHEHAERHEDDGRAPPLVARGAPGCVGIVAGGFARRVARGVAGGIVRTPRGHPLGVPDAGSIRDAPIPHEGMLKSPDRPRPL